MNVLDGLTGVELDELSSSLICGLDLLEVLRYPRFVSNEDRQRETTLDTSGLMEEINCAICCGIIQKCVVIKACLHRFCSECISKAMRTGTNECPKCRKRIPSKRAYVPDPLYDSIILSIIPNVKVFEEMCYAFLMAFNKGRENDPTLEAIRHTFLEGGQHVKLQDVTSLHSAIGESGLSIECAFDKKQYMKEIIIRRRKILDAMPESPGVLRTCYKLEASGQDIPQVQPNVLFEDGSITLHHLSMYIKRKIGLLPFQPLYFYTKEPWFVAKPTQTLAYIRNMVKHPSHYVLTVYYHTSIPECNTNS